MKHWFSSTSRRASSPAVRRPLPNSCAMRRLWRGLSRVFIQRWSAVALPGSCSLVRNSELWQGLRWPSRPKLELSAAMQSNKSSKERDGAAKDKQIAFFFFFFLQNSVSSNGLFGSRQRETEWRREEESDTNRQTEIESTNATSGTL